MGVIASTIVILSLIIVAGAPYIIIGQALQYRRDQPCLAAPRVYISELFPHLKTGDILLFRPFNPISHRYLCGTIFDHAALILREGELVHTSEMEPAGIVLMPDPDRPGAKIYLAPGLNAAPLLTRIKYCNGVTYAMRLSRPLDPGRERALKAATRKAYAYPTLPHGLAEWVLGWKSGSRHCFQHIAHALDAADLTPLGRPPGQRGAPLADAGFLEVCRIICDLEGRPLPDGYYYEPPVEIIYDIGAQRLDAAPAQPAATPAQPAAAPAQPGDTTAPPA